MFSFRLLAMLIFVPIACGTALFRPFLGLLLLVAMYYFRPDVWEIPTWFRPQLWLTIAVGLGWLSHLKHWRFDAITFCGTLVVGLNFATSFFAVADPGISYESAIVVMKVSVLMLFTVNLVDSSAKLHQFLWANIIGMIWNLKTILWVGLHGGTIQAQRVDVGVGQGGGANYIAMILAMSLPFLYFRILNGKGRERTLATMLAPLYVVALIVTGSRGGFLSVAGVALFLVFASNRKLLGGVIIMALFGLFMLVLPDAFAERFKQGLGDDQTRDKSADSRLKLWKAGWTMYTEHPYTGVGLDNFSLLSARYVGFYATKALDPYQSGRRGAGFVAHSTWFQMLAEGGSVVSLPFFSMFFLAFSMLRRIKKAKIPEPLRSRVQEQASTLQAVLIAFIISSTFGSHLKIDFLWWYLGCVSALNYIVNGEKEKVIAQARIDRLQAMHLPEPVLTGVPG